MPTPMSDQRVVDARIGARYRITDPCHPNAGRTGTLEFIYGGAVWLRIDGADVSAKVEQLAVAPELIVLENAQ